MTVGGEMPVKGGHGAVAAVPHAEAPTAAAAGADPAAAAAPEDDGFGGMLLVGGKAGAYHCNYCMRDISATVRFKCAHCADWDLCIDCFAAGVELGKHKKTHPYRCGVPSRMR